MSNPRPTCQFFTPFPREDKEFQAVSDIEHHQAFKKPRISEVGSNSTMAARRYRGLHYKTRLCNNFERRRCYHGEECLYAHGVEELRNTSENEKGVLGRTEFGNHGICDRVGMCNMFFNQGRCAYGDKCRFRHVIPRSSRDESVMNSSAGGSVNGGCGQFGSKRSVGLDVDTNGGRNFRQQGSFAAGRGMPSDTSIASGSFAHGHDVPRKLCGYTTVENKYSKTCTSSGERQVRDGNFDWNELAKMSRIYADWIEEIPLVHRNVQC